MAEQDKTEKRPRKLRTEDDTDEKIPHPYLELYRHCMLRGANVGSVLAMVLAPPVLYASGTRQPRELATGTARATLYGVVRNEKKTL